MKNIRSWPCGSMTLCIAYLFMIRQWSEHYATLTWEFAYLIGAGLSNVHKECQVVSEILMYMNTWWIFSVQIQEPGQELKTRKRQHPTKPHLKLNRCFLLSFSHLFSHLLSDLVWFGLIWLIIVSLSSPVPAYRYLLNLLSGLQIAWLLACLSFWGLPSHFILFARVLLIKTINPTPVSVHSPPRSHNQHS